MASSGMGRRVVPALAASSTGALPLDAVYEILLRLPANELCRLRIVCRPWRALLSDPQFAAAHAARHPLVMASHRVNANQDCLVDILDLSGSSIRKVRGQKGDCVRNLALDLIHVENGTSGNHRLLNPATGAVYHFSNRRGEYGFHMFEQTASKGEYRVLKISYHFSDHQFHQQSEVCTLNNSSHAIWRGKQPPPQKIALHEHSSVVIDGIAYFLSWSACSDLTSYRDNGIDLIITFDLETEAWGRTICGPHFSFPDDAFLVFRERVTSRLDRLTLANLSGSLAVVHGPGQVPKLDIWIQMESLWVKQYSIKFGKHGRLRFVHPVLVLDDQRLVLYKKDKGLLQIYNPRGNTFRNVVELRHCTGISMYTGNLLSLEC